MALVVGPALLWRTDRSSAGYQSRTEAARVLKSLTYTILGFLGDEFEDAEPSIGALAAGGGGGDVTLIKSSKNKVLARFPTRLVAWGGASAVGVSLKKKIPHSGGGVGGDT